MAYAQAPAVHGPVVDPYADAPADQAAGDDEDFVSLSEYGQPAAGATPSSAAGAAPCNCPECQKAAAADKKKKEDLKKAVNTAYQGVFYNNKFDYIANPNYKDWYPGDRFKHMQFGDNWTVDIGGQYRMRHHVEQNFRGLGLTGVDDNFLLHRTRLFANVKYGDRIRVFAEGIDAESNYEEVRPRGIEVNRADMLNLFADFDLFERDKKTLTFRVGRQELLYGNQRLISPLDWANTRRTFEGINFLWRGEDWNADFFFVEPVQTDPRNFDTAIDEEEFFGMYATYKGIKDHTFDIFALQFNNSLLPASFKYTTLGGRWLGTHGQWLGEVEGGVQFGENTDGSSHSAGYWTVGGGRKFDHDWKPQLWVYYDWASGSNDRGAGNGFNHLFPLAHKYLGFMDLFARSNIESPNVQLTFQPHQKVSVLMWYYYLMLQNGADTPYNVNMVPFRTGNAPPSRELGHEIDLTVTYTINPRMDILFGYSHFFAGNYYKQSAEGPLNPANSPGVPWRGDADFIYTQFQWNF